MGPVCLPGGEFVLLGFSIRFELLKYQVDNIPVFPKYIEHLGIYISTYTVLQIRTACYYSFVRLWKCNAHLVFDMVTTTALHFRTEWYCCTYSTMVLLLCEL